MSTEDTSAGTGGMPTPNAANPQQIKASTKMREYLDDQDANDLRTVLQTQEGIRLFLRILAEGRMGESPFNADPMQMAHDVGFQHIPREMIRWLNTLDPDLYPRLLLQRSKQLKELEIVRRRLHDAENALKTPTGGL